MKKTKAQLQREIGKLRSQLDAIEESEATKFSKPLVGQCFKYHNSYGHGEKWWLYAQIVEADGRWVKVISFQDDRQGRIEFENNKAHMANQFAAGGYQRISRDEYQSAYTSLILRLPRPMEAVK